MKNVQISKKHAAGIIQSFKKTPPNPLPLPLYSALNNFLCLSTLLLLVGKYCFLALLDASPKKSQRSHFLSSPD